MFYGRTSGMMMIVMIMMIDVYGRTSGMLLMMMIMMTDVLRPY